MYAPYFYARPVELSAIAESLAYFGSPQQIVPLLEPVTVRTTSLNGTLTKLARVNAACYLIVNPYQHELNTAANRAVWQGATAAHVANPALVRPVLHEHDGLSPADLAAFVRSFPRRDLGIVLTSNSMSASDVASAVRGSSVRIFLAATVNPLPYRTALGANQICIISDNFRPAARNADYFGEQWLASNHLDFASDGYAGFSDFTVLPSALSVTGGRVGAAAFHLTYKDASNGNFWVQHFVSDETDQNVGSAQTKLLEAIAHLEAQLTLTPARFIRSAAIAEYQRQGRTSQATNLSGNKKLQISHHLQTVSVHLGI